MAVPSYASSSDFIPDGPVLSVIHKRLRALRKKLNRICQMEESLATGKSLNKEQEETLRSKQSVLAGIEELEKLSRPLSQAVDKEIELALEKFKQRVEAVGKAMQEDEENARVAVLSDLLSLLYFGRVFDVKTLMSGKENLLRKMHERNCCLTYDYVTDDDDVGDPLKEWDMDVIGMMGSLLISRPLDCGLSHKYALQRCVEHAKLWLEKSEQPIDPSLDITYAGLRERLNKIKGSDYFTTTPQIRAPIEVAAAIANYNAFQIPLHESMAPEAILTEQTGGSDVEFDEKEEKSPYSNANKTYDNESNHTEEHRQEGSDIDNTPDLPAHSEQGSKKSNGLQEHEYATQRSSQNYTGYLGVYRNGRNQGRDHLPRLCSSLSPPPLLPFPQSNAVVLRRKTSHNLPFNENILQFPRRATAQ